MRVVIVIQHGLVEAVYSDMDYLDTEIIDCDTTVSDEAAGIDGVLEMIETDENLARVY